MRTPLIYQSQEKGCGFAAAKMLLCHASGRKDFQFAQEPFIEEKAPSLAEIAQYARKLGLSISYYKCQDLEPLLDESGWNSLVLLSEGGCLHMAYLIRYRRGSFFLLDPARGKRSVPREEFLSIFQGVYGVEEGYEDIAPFFPKPRIQPLLHEGLSSLLCLLPSLFLFAAFFFLGKGIDSMVWAILLIFSFAFQAVALLCSQKQMRDFDHDFLPFVEAESCLKRKERFQHYQKYKSQAFSLVPGILTGAMNIVLPSLFFAFSDPLLGLGIVASLAVGSVMILVFAPEVRRKENRVSRLEEGFFSPLSKPETRPKVLKELSQGSAAFFSLLGIQELLSWAVCIGLAFLLEWARRNFEPSRFLMELLLLLFLYSQWRGLSKKWDQLEEKRKEEAYFRLHFLRRSDLE